MPTYNPITLNRTQDDTNAIAIRNAITSAGVTPTAAMTNAAHFFVTACKWASLWSKFTAVYGLMGGTAASHAINWKAPGTFNITWNGTVTHNANGATGNGSTGYGDTGIIPSTSLTLGNSHMSVYSRTDGLGSWAEMGCASSGTPFWEFAIKYTGGTTYPSMGNPQDQFANNFPATGLYTNSRTTTTRGPVFRNGTKIKTFTSTATGLPTRSIYILGSRDSSTGALLWPSSRNCSFFSIGSGLTDQDAFNLSWIVQATQKILSRDV